ncbi:protein phosphatase regulator SHP1 [Spizellomyces punctatus DAOM BR117]|uniref:SEP domain-containing protein n=1 Tax=Spizellomyces punctatus (strain DAOM BR117) TaxID=645134 RepID=A0A0L0HPN7_SPIPD|nr:protein phosphatase regulator SHP1 [Spizellomyces punctatus DAOM BR117]KND02930.1 hypothetical protein SPPG_02010 [Spizellomyces punctatus DAOM BR117]|eukprot:XP_016610969.1 hypothetical protein SPPG_02010 [Spizellomyces punctatus DAOM BR117]
MADAQETIKQFTGITGCTEDQAKFFLEANGWDLESATSSYFEDSSEPGTSTRPSGPTSATPHTEPAPPSSSSSSSSRPTRDTRVKTFRDLMEGQAASDSEEEDQTFFAGGEKSGLMMQGGPKSDQLVKKILDKAAKSGPAPEEFKKNEKKTFVGAGYRLGSEDEPVGPSTPAVQPSARTAPEPVERHLTFWRNGFSIDDGPLRGYDDPESQEFLRAINSGRAPTHLLNVAYDQPVEVKVTRNLEQDYIPPPKKPVAAFSGSGQRLGGVTSTLPGSFPPSQSSTTNTTLEINPSLPTTTLQLRLPDGTRLPIQLNTVHTLGDVRRVLGSRPDVSARPFGFFSSFPTKELKEDVSVEEAGVLGAVVVVRWI